MYCPKCGNEVPEEEKYCGNCGADLEAATEEVSEALETEINPINKKHLIAYAITAGAILLAFIVSLISFFLYSKNNYKSPVERDLEAYNKILTSGIDNPGDYVAFCKKEVSEIYAILVDIEELNMGNSYNLDVEIKYMLKEKEKLGKEDIAELQSNVKDIAEDFESLASAFEKLTDSDIEEIANTFDITKAEVKIIIKNIRKIADKFKKAKVSSGYSLSLKFKYYGDDAAFFSNYSQEYYSYKIDGKWVSNTDFSVISKLNTIFKGTRGFKVYD